MATLLDTSALVVFLRSRRSSPAHERLARATGEALRNGQGLVSAASSVELLVGSQGSAGQAAIRRLLESLPVVGMGREVSLLAGSMGAYLRHRGASVPQVDLAIAATAVWLDVPVLTADSDFFRGRRVAWDDPDPATGVAAGGVPDDGIWRPAPLGAPRWEDHLPPPMEAWRSLMIHPASVG